MPGTEMHDNIFKEQVANVYERLPSSLAVNVANSFILIYVQWNVIAHSTLIAWFSALLLLSFVRLVSYYYKKTLVLVHPRRWGFFYISGLLLSGIIWGAAGILLFPANNIAHQIIVAFVLGGMVAGATASSAAMSGAFYLYCIPALTPILYMYLHLDNHVGNSMFFMIIIYALFSMATYRHINKIIFDLIVAKIKNAEEIKSRRLVEVKVKQQQDFLEAVLYNIDDGIVACNEKGLITLLNRAAKKFHGDIELGIPPEDWANHYDLYMEDGKTPMQKENIPLYKAFYGQNVDKQLMHIIPKDGEPLIMLASGQALFGKDGDKIGAVVSMHDITKEKKAEIALNKAYSELELKVQQRTEDLVDINRKLRIEMEKRMEAYKEKEDLIIQLQGALNKVKTLSGFLPICASCKKIRDDKGYWKQIEEYIRDHSEAEFSHSICPGCLKKLYPDLNL